MRRLPIFFVLDVSESMVGENLYRLDEGIQRVYAELRTDPHALDTVWISVICFAGKVRKLSDLTELPVAIPPRLPVGGGTSLGRALIFLMDEIDRSLRKNTPQAKGDWKPIVFLITDGKPTDDVEPAIRRWQSKYASAVTLVAISIGRTADLRVLSRLTSADKVLTLDDDSEAGFARFISWVTQSVQARSRSVGDPAKEEQLAVLVDNPLLKKLNLDKPIDSIDETNAYFVSKCQKTGLPYISRYEPVQRSFESSHLNLQTVTYRLTGSYPVSNGYFELSSDHPNVATVDSSQLYGNPQCPHCGNPIGFAMCDCGNTFCMSEEGMQTCPWCHERALFSHVDDDAESVDLTRARG